MLCSPCNYRLVPALDIVASRDERVSYQWLRRQVWWMDKSVGASFFRPETALAILSTKVRFREFDQLSEIFLS
jgi:hypothetical protein